MVTSRDEVIARSYCDKTLPTSMDWTLVTRKKTVVRTFEGRFTLLFFLEDPIKQPVN